MKSALEHLSGTLELRSESGRGTLFRVTIPSLPERVRKRRILIWNTDASVELALSECFRSAGYDFRTVGLGERVESVAAEFRPELILLDLSHGGEESRRALLELRGSNWGGAIPVIAMSTSDQVGDRAKAFEGGASDYLVKPFDLRELLARVKTQLSKGSDALSA